MAAPKEVLRTFVPAKIAIISRIFMTLLQILLNNLLPDHQADAFHQDHLTNPGIGDYFIEFLLGGFRKWDGAHFLHIAEHGYTTGRMLAFFPLYPGLVRFLGNTLRFPLGMVMQLRSILLVTGWLLNVMLFTVATILLYKLTLRVCKNEQFAKIAAVLFCINPASVFMTAMYTETSFSLLSFGGMLLLEDRSYLLSAVMFGIATGARSNGIVSIGFISYHSIQFIMFVITRTHSHINLSSLKNMCRSFVVSATRIIYSAAIILFPFALYQSFAYLTICKQERELSIQRIIQYGIDVLFRKDSYVTTVVQNGEHFDNSVPLWCQKSFVIPYSEVQAEHWNVGLLNYYEFKQIPNFILALPVIIISLYGVRKYCIMNWDHVRVLGLLQQIREDIKKTDDPISQLEGFYSSRVFVYLAHLCVLLVFGVCCMHIQVITRFLFSSSPVPIWIASHIIQSSLQANDDGSPSPKLNGSVQELMPLDIVWRTHLDWKGRLIRGYFLGYCAIGVALHCNFLPWT